MARQPTTSPNPLRNLERARSASRSNSMSTSGLVEHLGDDLPDADGYTSADDQQKAEHQLLAESARPDVSTAPPERKGKLKRINHLGRTAGFQRRMGKTTKARPDQYDLQDSPQKPRHAPSGSLDGPPQPSPLKKQRKAQRAQGPQQRFRAATPTRTNDVWQVPLAPSLELHESAAPRHSPRKSQGSERGQSPQVLIERTRDHVESTQGDPLQDQGGTMDPGDDGLAQDQSDVAPPSVSKRPPDRPRKHKEPIAMSTELRESELESLGDRQSSPPATDPPSPGQRPRGRPSKRKSGAHGSTEAIERLKMAHGGEAVKHRADEPLVVGQTGPEEDDDFVEADAPVEEPIPRRIAKVRPSEMFRHGAPDTNLVDDTELEVQPVQQSQKGKRNPEQANTSKRQQRKPRLTSQVDVPETADTSMGQLQADEGNVNDSRILGQWQALNAVFRNVKKVGVSIKDGKEQDRTRVDLKDDDVIEIKRLCSKARETLDRLRDEPDHRQELADPPEELDEIRLRIQGLCGKNVEYPTNLGSRRKPLEIYSNLIPNVLIKLLRTMIQCYYDMDKEDGDRDSDLTEAHLVTVTRFIGLISAMGAGAEAYTVRPRADLAIVKPVKHGLIVPLRHIKAVFAEHLAKLERERQNRRRRQREREEEARRERREHQEKRHKAEEAKLKKKWKSLHDSRRFVERGLLSREKQKHLRFPDPAEAEPEYDSIGRSFQRQSVFRTRIGPLPAAAERARCMKWPLKAIEALQHGLERHTGPLVYEKIFAEHCGDARGALNPYNVTEIVSVAAMLKHHLSDDLGYREDWIQAIPVWPQEHSYMDEENGVDDEPVENVADESGLLDD